MYLSLVARHFLMSLQSLRKRAKAGTLEVEHLLKEAALRTPGLRAELEALSRECLWASESQQPDGSLQVPLARWAHVAGAYADHGYEGLAALARDPGYSSFVIGLLEELGNQEAIGAMTSMFGDVLAMPEHSLDTAHRLVAAINLLCSIKASGRVAPPDAVTLSRFLERVLPIAETNAQRATVMYAARGVGDQRILDVLAALPDADAPFSGARASALKAIRKRLRDSASRERD